MRSTCLFPVKFHRELLFMACRCLWQILLQGGQFEFSLINGYTVLLSFISQERTLKIWVWLLCAIRCALYSFTVQQLCIPDLFRRRWFSFLCSCWRCSGPGYMPGLEICESCSSTCGPCGFRSLLPTRTNPPDFCKINHWKQWEKEPMNWNCLLWDLLQHTCSWNTTGSSLKNTEVWNKAPKNAYIFMVAKALVSTHSFIPLLLSLSPEMPATPFKHYYLNCFPSLK